jgi:hypothetical protein
MIPKIKLHSNKKKTPTSASGKHHFVSIFFPRVMASIWRAAPQCMQKKSRGSFLVGYFFSLVPVCYRELHAEKGGKFHQPHNEKITIKCIKCVAFLSIFRVARAFFSHS